MSPKPHSRPDHQRRLAHLARVQDVAVLSGEQRLMQVLVGLPLDVGGCVGGERTADDEEWSVIKGHDRWSDKAKH